MSYLPRFRSAAATPPDPKAPATQADVEEIQRRLDGLNETAMQYEGDRAELERTIKAIRATTERTQVWVRLLGGAVVGYILAAMLKGCW